MTSKKSPPKNKLLAASNEETFRLLFENHPVPMWVYDIKTLAFLEVNHAAVEKYGYTRDEFLALTIKDIRPREDVMHLLTDLEKERPVLQHSGEWRHCLKNGRVIDVDITSHMLEFEGREAALVMVQDITARRQAENILRQSEERYRLLFDRMADGLYRSTHEGKFVDVNPAMIRMFGYASKEEMLKVDIKKDLYFTPEERGGHILDTGREETETYRMRRKDGSEIWVEDHGLYVHDEQGNVLFHEGMLRDITERKRAEEALRENEGLLKESQIIAKIGSYVLDFSTGMWKSSAVLDKLFGIDDSYIRSVEGWADLIHPDHRQQMIDYFTNEVIGKHIRFDKEYKIIRKSDTAEQWVHGLGELEFDTQNNPLKMHGTIQDITERKQADESLAASEAELRALFASMRDVVLVIDRDGVYRKIAPTSPDLLARPSEELLGKNLRDIFPAKQAETFISTIQLVLKKEQTSYIEYEMTIGEQKMWFATSISPMDHENTLWVARDITAHKHVEEKFHLQSTALNAAANAIVITRLDGTIEWVNPAFSLLTGYTLEEAVNKNPRQLIKSGVHDRYFYKSMWDTILSGEVWHGELTNRRKDGSLYHEEQTITPLKNAEGRITHFISIKQDITERKQAEESARQRLAEQNILHQASQSLLSVHLDPETIYMTLHQAVVQIMPCEAFNIVLDDENGGDYHAVYLYDAGHRYPAQRIPRGKGLSGKVISRGETLFIDDNLQSNVPTVHYGTPTPVRSILAVPLRKNNESVGMVSAQSYQSNVYNERHRVLLETLTAQVTTVIENARLFEAERKQHQMSDALRDALRAGASMSVSLDFETILDRLLETLLRVVPFEGGSIMFVQSEKQKISLAKMHGYEKLGKQLIDKISNFSFDIASVENLRWLINNKEPLVISDVELYPGWVRVPETSFTRSWVGAPIIINDEVIALFSLDSTEPNFFTNEHAELLRAFTGQASLALQNARLFDETARRAREFASLYETSNALSAENQLNTLLQVIVDHARKLLGSASSGMYLYLSETSELELTVDTTPYIPFGTRLKLGEGIAGRVAQTHQPLRIDDYSAWEGRSPAYDGASIRAVLEVPMHYGGELIGVLTADEVGDSERKFTEADERLLSLLASQAAGAIHSARLREQTARRLDQLQALHTIDRAISSSFDLHPILNTVISQTIAQLNVDAADVLLFHPHLQTLEYIAGQGFHTRAIEGVHLRLGEGHAGRAAFERRTIHIPNLPETGSNFMRASLLAGEGFLEYYGVPLIAKGEVKGVLEVFHRVSVPRTPEWLDFLETLAGQAAITIDQTQLFDDLQRANLELIIAYDATIEGWSHAMDLRDKETEGHTLRVTEMTMALAKAMGINEKEMLHARRGALLHDIGKMGVPDNILLKEGKLTDEEWVIMRQHPTFSYEMLKPIKYLQQSLDIPYCHHEKWDGSGYPRGLKGEEIPLVARIFAIIDVWDAVTINRPYRKAWTKQKALKYIREQSGKHFEPRIVKAFLKLFGT